jgi:hypothetical protein
MHLIYNYQILHTKICYFLYVQKKSSPPPDIFNIPVATTQKWLVFMSGNDVDTVQGTSSLYCYNLP